MTDALPKQPDSVPWDVDFQIELGPKHGPSDLEVRFEEAGVWRYDGSLSRRQIAAAFLRHMAEQIESGELPEGTL